MSTTNNLCKECQNIATMRVSQCSNYSGEREWITELCLAHFRDVEYKRGKHYIVEAIIE